MSSFYNRNDHKLAMHAFYFQLASLQLAASHPDGVEWVHLTETGFCITFQERRCEAGLNKEG